MPQTQVQSHSPALAHTSTGQLHVMNHLHHHCHRRYRHLKRYHRLQREKMNNEMKAQITITMIRLLFFGRRSYGGRSFNHRYWFALSLSHINYSWLYTGSQRCSPGDVMLAPHPSRKCQAIANKASNLECAIRNFIKFFEQFSHKLYISKIDFMQKTKFSFFHDSPPLNIESIIIFWGRGELKLNSDTH